MRPMNKGIAVDSTTKGAYVGEVEGEKVIEKSDCR